MVASSPGHESGGVALLAFWICGPQRCTFDDPLTPTSDKSVDCTKTINESFDGSPLKLEVFNTDSFTHSPVACNSPSKNTNKFKPVTVDEARIVLSQYNLSWQSADVINKKFDGFPPLWVLCDGPVFQKLHRINEMWEKRPSCFNKGKGTYSKCHAKYSVHVRDLCDIHFHWKKLTNLLESPPLDAKAGMKVTAEAGDCHSPVYMLYRELVTLQQLLRAITTGNIEWSEQCVEFDSYTDHHNQGDMTLANDTLSLKITSSKLQIKRNEMDFTEQLWLILKECQEYEDLVKCQQYLFDCLIKEDLQFMIHKENTTTVAQLIRDSYHSMISAPLLEGICPLEILLEIGANKIYNDYIKVFKDLEMVDILGEFIHDGDAISERVAKLEKLHYTVELLALKHYETNLVSNGHQFTIPVDTSSVRPAIAKLQPNSWQVIMSVNKCGKTIQLVYRFTDQPPVDHIDSTLPDVDYNDKLYYVTCLKEDVIVL
ncbi:hypothetical protein LSH36_13g18005 [Paralvinella palmiformis]|uniref:Protein zwilch n=1 Tax=Paralvinella palmiformis TaxID=53620 RepID=A0AAD9KDY2_9ANNE|nr:hypothetical protein LSH36_13g18005 [Paralvinella palmiformis]